MTVERKNGCVSLRRIWHAGDELIAIVPHIARLETRNGRTLHLRMWGTNPSRQPCSMGHFSWLCMKRTNRCSCRPWMFPGKNACTVQLPENWIGPASLNPPRIAPRTRLDCPVAFQLAYHHGGWPNASQVMFRPLSWSTTVPQQQVVAVWDSLSSSPRTAAPDTVAQAVRQPVIRIMTTPTLMGTDRRFGRGDLRNAGQLDGQPTYFTPSPLATPRGPPHRRM